MIPINLRHPSGKHLYEDAGMRVVQFVKKHIAPSMDENDGGELLWQLTQLCEKAWLDGVRAGLPEADGDIHAPSDQSVGLALAALKNVGCDTSCGACMEVAFTGVTTNTHTCRRSESERCDV